MDNKEEGESGWRLLSLPGADLRRHQSLRQLAPDAVWSGGCMIAIISQSSPLIAQVAARVALLAGFILLTLASTGEWVPVQVLTAGM